MLCKQQRRGIFNGLYNSFTSLGCLFGWIPCGLGSNSFLGCKLAPAMNFFSKSVFDRETYLSDKRTPSHVS